MGKGKVMGKYSHFKLAPLTLPYIAALTPGDVEVEIIDELVDDIDFDLDVDLVGLTVLTPLATRAYEIADRFRKRGVKVVLGGVHITMCPEEASSHADALVLGEADETWPRLIADFQKGKLQKIYRCPRPPDLKGLPIPRWDLLKMRYLPTYVVQTTRGCPFDCEFCAVTTFFGGKYRTRPIDDVLNEVQTLIATKRQRSPLGDIFFFTDDNIYSNRSYAKEWLKELARFKVKWLGQAPITMAWDEELLKISADSGCIGVLVGFETLSQKNIETMGKKINKVEEYEDAIKRIHSYGIKLIGSFMFGLDDDDKGIFERVVKFMVKNRIDVPGMGTITPYPGTRLYKRLREEGRIIKEDWADYDSAQAVFRPRHMTPEELDAGLAWAWKKSTSYPSILRRNILPSNRSIFYTALNIIFRHTVRKLF
jgi:radical SAM superfamily enzyme YgiQ (UPF0313 family)